MLLRLCGVVVIACCVLVVGVVYCCCVSAGFVVVVRCWCRVSLSLLRLVLRLLVAVFVYVCDVCNWFGGYCWCCCAC